MFECSDENEMNSKERELVDDAFVERKDTYNLKRGGEGGFDYINKNCHNNIGNCRRVRICQDDGCWDTSISSMVIQID